MEWCICLFHHINDLKYDLFGVRPNSASIFFDSFVLGVLGVSVSFKFKLGRVVYMFFDTLMLLILFLSLQVKDFSLSFTFTRWVNVYSYLVQLSM